MTTPPLLPNHLGGQWVTGTGAGTPLFDPVLGTELARVSSAGLDLAAGFAFAREQGGTALRACTNKASPVRVTNFTQKRGPWGTSATDSMAPCANAA